MKVPSAKTLLALNLVCLDVLGSTTAYVEKKPFVHLGEAMLVLQIASSDITQWLGCIMGNVGTRFWKGRRMRGMWGRYLWHIDFRLFPKLFIMSLTVYCFSTPGAYITHNTTQPLNDFVTFELTKGFVLMFQLWNSAPQDQQTYFNS